MLHAFVRVAAALFLVLLFARSIAGVNRSPFLPAEAGLASLTGQGR
jgi:hypothetical protein